MKDRTMKRSISYLLAVAITVFALPLGFARGDTIQISDLTEGNPTVQTFDASGNDNTATNVTNLVAAAETVSFTYTSTDFTYNGGAGYFDLLEPDGSVSDRLLLVSVADGSPVLNLTFSSDPAPLPSPINFIGSALEDGTFQGFTIGDTFQMRSDVDAVPEPATLTLLGLGVAGLAGYGWRRRRARAAQAAA
jgi:hypothetical protein